jgi:hypothetical protein
MNENTPRTLDTAIEHAKFMMPELDFINVAALNDIEMIARFHLYLSGGMEYLASNLAFLTLSGECDFKIDEIDCVPFDTKEDNVAIGRFYLEVTRNPDAFGVPGQYRDPNGDKACAWVWMNIERFADSHPVAAMIAANKRVEMAAWNRFAQKNNPASAEPIRGGKQIKTGT